MREPLPRNSPINSTRIGDWTRLFLEYRIPGTEERIDEWLNQFEVNDRDIAARILDSVDFMTNEQIADAFRSILNNIQGWSRDESSRTGKWRFVAFSTSAGESGDSMLYKFRHANGLNGRTFKHLFIYKSELLKEELGPKDKVVFVDDFSGTGSQICDAWLDNIKELLPGNPEVYIVLIAANILAKNKIEEKTNLSVRTNIELTERQNFFSASCTYFNRTEKNKILRYCKLVDNRFPKGFGDCGFVIVFAHTCPNNSIPILRANHPSWMGLFPRYD